VGLAWCLPRRDGFALLAWQIIKNQCSVATYSVNFLRGLRFVQELVIGRFGFFPPISGDNVPITERLWRHNLLLLPTSYCMKFMISAQIWGVLVFSNFFIFNEIIREKRPMYIRRFNKFQMDGFGLSRQSKRETEHHQKT
jgi:hypothetical protein